MSQNLRQHLSPVWSHYTEVLTERAEGVYIYGADGRRYLDFTPGIGVTNTGHCHAEIVAAAQQQTARLIHGQANIVYHQPMLDLVSELLTVMPPDLESFFFSNSGAEAVEAAIKLGRQASYPAIGDVRGLGLMVAAEFTTADGQPDAQTAKAVRLECLEKGLMLLTCGPYDNVVRWIPPLIVNQAQMDEALTIFETALEAMAG